MSVLPHPPPLVHLLLLSLLLLACTCSSPPLLRAELAALLRSAEAHGARGDHAAAAREYDTAVGRAEEALLRSPRVAARTGGDAAASTAAADRSRAALDALQVAHYNRAAAREALGDRKRAMADYASALRVIVRRHGAYSRSAGFDTREELGRAAEVHLKMADLSSRGREWVAAARHYGAAARIRPGDPSTHYNLGSAYLNQYPGRLRRDPGAATASAPVAPDPGAASIVSASRAFREAVKLHPANTRYRVSLGVALCLAGNAADAHTILGGFLALEIPRNATASLEALGGALGLHMYAAFAIEDEQPVWALRHLERALDMWRLLARNAYTATPPASTAAASTPAAAAVALLPRHLQRSIPTLFYRLGRMYEEQERRGVGGAERGGEERGASSERGERGEGAMVPGRRRGRHEQLYAEAVASPLGVWTNQLQRPGYFFVRSPSTLPPLVARPWWHCGGGGSDGSDADATTSDNEQSCGGEESKAPPPSLGVAIRRTIADLEANFAAIRAEFVSNLALGGRKKTEVEMGGMGGDERVPEGARNRSSSNVVVLGSDDEKVADAGHWNRIELVRDGVRVYATTNYTTAADAAAEAEHGKDTDDASGGERNVCRGSSSEGTDQPCPMPHRPPTVDLLGGGHPLTNAFPTTVKVLERILSAAADRLPRGSAVFSVLQPSTHLRQHCGPTNHRLRLHLPLVVPPAVVGSRGGGEGGEETEGTEGTQGTEEGGPELKGAPRIRVGGHTQRWVEGRVLVFDDSFEHEAWNPSPHHPRAVLLLDVWHPDLGEAERDAIRRDFEGAREGAPAGAGWADGYRSSGHGRGPAPH